MSKLPYLNLGCGITWHPDWTNVDFVSTGEDVMAHNLLKGIPFNDASFEVVYHSHVLEHMPKNYAENFTRECYRVLKPGGIIRVVIPDLEQIALNYVRYLNESLQGIPGAAEKYEWTMLELFDQLVRNVSGGEMISYIKDASKNNDQFLLERNGHEVKRIMDMLRAQKEEEKKPAQNISPSQNPISGLKKKIKDRIQKPLSEEDHKALAIGQFRLQGEIHQWMYDRYSLKMLLEKCGFKNCERKTAFQSGIKDWDKFNLDGNSQTKEVRKPDSLFMEATK
jgi:predicted SAM-dependent methyltransferase